MQHIQSQPREFAPLIELDLFIDVHSVPPGPEPGLDAPRQRICRMCAAEVLLFGLKDWWIRERKKGLLDPAIAERPDCPDGPICRRQKEHGKAFPFFYILGTTLSLLIRFSARKRVYVKSPFSPLCILLTGLYKTVNHVFDSAAEMPPEPLPAGYASTSSVAHLGGGDGVAAAASGPSFSSPGSTGGVRSQPSLDSEAMVDAALTNMIHDVEEPPSLPPLSDLAAGPTHTHSYPHPHSLGHVATHAALDIFDAL